MFHVVIPLMIERVQYRTVIRDLLNGYLSRACVVLDLTYLLDASFFPHQNNAHAHVNDAHGNGNGNGNGNARAIDNNGNGGHGNVGNGNVGNGNGGNVGNANDGNGNDGNANTLQEEVLTLTNNDTNHTNDTNGTNDTNDTNDNNNNTNDTTNDTNDTSDTNDTNTTNTNTDDIDDDIINLQNRLNMAKNRITTTTNNNNNDTNNNGTTNNGTTNGPNTTTTTTTDTATTTTTTTTTTETFQETYNKSVNYFRYHIKSLPLIIRQIILLVIGLFILTFVSCWALHIPLLIGRSLLSSLSVPSDHDLYNFAAGITICWGAMYLFQYFLKDVMQHAEVDVIIKAVTKWTLITIKIIVLGYPQHPLLTP